MRELYICDTPFQLFNTLNIVYNSISEQRKTEERDLYVINQFQTAQKLASNVEKTGLFDHVYLLSRDETKFLPLGMKRNIRMSMDFLRPRVFLKQRLCAYDHKQISVNDYQRVYGSGAYSTVAAILKINPEAEFVLFEDGLGTYSETIDNIIAKSSGGRLNRLFCRIFHVGSYVCKPCKLMVNNVKACKSAETETDKVFPLPSFNDGFLSLCNEIFETKYTEGYSWYWLSQPLDCNPGAAEIRDAIRDAMLDFRSNICVRMHPRDLDVEYYSQFRIDKGTDLWELSILNKDPDKLVLIGTYSNAQVTPKLLFDVEPILFFLYLLNNSLSDDAKKTIREEVESIRKMYRHPERVIEITSIEEMRNKLNALINNYER